MTDVHTHILPKVDDGAGNVEESMTMLCMQRDQGVDTVVLTPHFFREQEDVNAFLGARERAFAQLNERLQAMPQEERSGLPRLILGAEVAWRADLANCDRLSELCIGQTKNLLLELPFEPWNVRMFSQIYDLMGRTGIVPVIAHIERYLGRQRREHIQEIFELGVPVQISAEAVCHPLRRGATLKLLRQGMVHAVASDCHNISTRPPKLKKAMDIVRSKLGEDSAEALNSFADELVKV